MQLARRSGGDFQQLFKLSLLQGKKTGWEQARHADHAQVAEIWRFEPGGVLDLETLEPSDLCLPWCMIKDMYHYLAWVRGLCLYIRSKISSLFEMADEGKCTVPSSWVWIWSKEKMGFLFTKRNTSKQRWRNSDMNSHHPREYRWIQTFYLSQRKNILLYRKRNPSTLHEQYKADWVLETRLYFLPRWCQAFQMKFLLGFSGWWERPC